MKGEMSVAALRFLSNGQEHAGSFSIGRCMWMYGGRVRPRWLADESHCWGQHDLAYFPPAASPI